jgi:hypothetical protein
MKEGNVVFRGAKTVYYSGDSGIIDLGLEYPKEILTGMTVLNGKLYAFTADKTFLLVKVSRFRLWWERVAKWLKVK